MTDEQRWLRNFAHTKGYRGLGVSHQLHDAMSEIDRAKTPRWWKACEQVMKVISDGGIVGLFGSFGRGKSLMGAFCAIEYWIRMPQPGYRELPPKPVMIFASEMLRQIQQSWKEGADTERALLNKFRECPLLVIDEVHERGDSDWTNNTMISIVKARESRQLPTVLITNETPSDYAVGAWASVMDRIWACDGDIQCEWENLRREHRSKDLQPMRAQE